MTSIDQSISFSSLLKNEFDEKFIEIEKNGDLIPFSVDVILQDLIDSGLTPIESLRILEKIHPHLERGIENYRIIKLINQAFQEEEWSHTYFKGNYLQPILIDFGEGETVEFNYRAIREYLRDSLKIFEYTSKTFKTVVDEMHRIVLSMRTEKLKAGVIENMVPSVLRNVIGINPFNKNQLDTDYQTVIKLSESVIKTWNFLPHTEKISTLILLFDSIYRIVLLYFNYLPGFSHQSTITQINQLIAELTEQNQNILSDKEIHLLGKSSRQVSELFQKNSPDLSNYEWIDTIVTLREVVEGLVDESSISWLIVVDQSGNELYGRFSNNMNSRYKSLLGMAISGVQTLVNELTDKSIRQIDQEEGSILIERHELFSVIVMVDTVSPSIKQHLTKLSSFIISDLREHLQNFKGNVSVFEDNIDLYIDKNMSSLFRGV